jgi:hypothetical protein
MFYCDDCATKNGWPETYSKSKGLCEVCRKPAICNDRPSSSLPLPKQTLREEADTLRTNISYQEKKIKELQKAVNRDKTRLEKTITNCSHEWEEPQLVIDPSGKARGEWWSRTCKNCGHTQNTTRTETVESVAKIVPVF